MTFVYSVDGLSSFTTNPTEGKGPTRPESSSVLFYNLRLIENNASGGQVLDTYVETVIDYATVIAKYTSTAAGSAIVGNGGLVNLEVPFIYGQPLSLNLTFRLGAQLDHRITSSGANTLVNMNLIDELSADFSNTASLLAIVNEEQEDLTISGINNDYTAFASTVFPEPVPVPPAVILFGSALIAMFSRRRRTA